MTIISFASGSLIVGKSEKARVFLKDKVGLYSNEEAWCVVGKIHFEEHSGSDYVGMLELNKEARKTLKEVFDIKSEFLCK